MSQIQGSPADVGFEPIICRAEVNKYQPTIKIKETKGARLVTYTLGQSFNELPFWLGVRVKRQKITANHLLKLEKGWNGYDAEPPSRESVYRANVILLHLEVFDLPPNRIGASGGEGVAISFYRDDRYACIECFNSGEIVATTMSDTADPFAWDLTKGKDDIAKTLATIRKFLNAGTTPREVP